MWTRYRIQCSACEKITNLRVQIPEREILPINFQCLNCSSEIKGVLKVDFKKSAWSFDLTRGELVPGDYKDGDFFYEFSDVLPTKKPSREPHAKLMPTMRLPGKMFEILKTKKDLRKLHPNEDWENLKDLTRAYNRFDKPLIEKLAYKILKNFYGTDFFEYKSDLDYHRNYFLSLNRLMSSWINFNNHAEYVEWLCSVIFTPQNHTNPEITAFINEIFDPNVTDKIKLDIAELTLRFIELREYFFYAVGSENADDNYAALNNFNELKSFYTDCFEFIGRTSQYIFNIQNFHERGALNRIPPGCPRNVIDGKSFSELNHGEKLNVLNLSSDNPLQLLFRDCFDSRLRNGINHFKAKLDPDSQIIYYYPVTKRPEEEHQISYINFLNKSLDLFNSVLKIGQLAKVVNMYRFTIKRT